MSEQLSAASSKVNIPAGLLILGFGGHARSVADVALACGITELCFIDQNARENEVFLGFPVRSNWQATLPSGWQVFPASGNNEERRIQCQQVEERGWSLATLIAPTASVGVGCSIGQGSLIAHQAHIGPAAQVGTGCIINTGAVIDHESAIGDFSHISVNATIAGRCQIGRLVMIGAGATVIDKLEVADEVIVGAAGLVLHSIFSPGCYVGVPVRQVR